MMSPSSQEIRQYLEDLPHQGDEAVYAFLSLAHMGAPAFPFVIEELQTGKAKTPLDLIRILGTHGPLAESAVPVLRHYLVHRDPVVAVRAAGALLRIAPPQPEALRKIYEALRDPEAGIRRAAVQSLNWCIHRQHPDDPTRQCDATIAWLRSQGQELADTLAPLLGDKEIISSSDDGDLSADLDDLLDLLGEKAIHLVEQLRRLYHANPQGDLLPEMASLGAAGLALLREIAQDAPAQIRVTICTVLRHDVPGAQDFLLELLEDPEISVRRCAAGAFANPSLDKALVRRVMEKALQDPHMADIGLVICRRTGVESELIVRLILEWLLAKLRNGDDEQQCGAAYDLQWLGPKAKEAVPVLLDKIPHRDEVLTGLFADTVIAIDPEQRKWVEKYL